ncbi:hypothetical protein H7F51_09090 [Novosphingobium flavum]|uniref:Uncharacterized protein n=1 Tax=Novosphingobium flavum TaxID=1778672 RepID=A0A7X1FRN0_9SPHN|nr:hypothetical protein [Novosphingobium flavum]MBC2665678.1 hypothetical protein [Novosphingobium flavum]
MGLPFATTRVAIKDTITIMITETPSGSVRLPEEALRLLVEWQTSRSSSIDTSTTTAFQALFGRMASLLHGPAPTGLPQFYLASLDPGKGKTEAACAFLKAWASLNFQPGGGVLVAVSRLDEVDAYIERSGLADDQFAVLVAQDANVGLKGRRDRTNAPVLFTTHEMIRRRTRGEPFSKVGAFHFHSRPRSCRIWDESLLPAIPATLRLDAIQGLLEPARPVLGEAITLVEDLIEKVSNTLPGNTVDIDPEFCVEGGHGKKLQGRDRERWEALVAWAGDDVVVTKSNRRGLELVGTTDRLPDDFAPAVILDASGRVRHTYRTWEANGSQLVRLPSATNNYAKLTIHHWDRACSRSTFDNPDDRAELLQVAANLINAEPDRRWLVVHHQPRGDWDAPTQLPPLIDGHGDASRVKFVHWGNHHGTNDFRDIDRVLVLGLWHLPTTVLQAYHLATMDPEEQSPNLQDDIRGMATGEHQHNLLQAICRASVRNSIDGVCGDCAAYVIGRIAGADTKAVLRDTFPGATAGDWRPLEAPLRGQAAAVAGVIEGRFADPEVISIRKADLRAAVGIERSQGLAQVLSRPDVGRWLAERGLGVTSRTVARIAA